jgi:hypothetical protein
LIGLGTGGDIRVGRQTKAGNLGNIAEELTDHILVNIERQVADEEGVALGADGVTVLLGALVGAGLGVGVVGLAGSEVKVDLATIDLLARHGLVSLGSRGGISEVDVAETTAATSSTVRDNTSADNALAVLESLVQAIIINAPGQAASEESLGAAGVGLSVGLGLLGGSIDLLISLALLRGRGLLSLLLLRGRIVGVGVGIRVGVILGRVSIYTASSSEIRLQTLAAALAGFSSSLSESESESEDSASALAAPLVLGLASSSESDSLSESESDSAAFLSFLPLATGFLAVSSSDDSSESELSEASASDSLSSESESSSSSDSSEEDSGSTTFFFLDFFSSFSILSAAALATSFDLDLELCEDLVTPPFLTEVRGSAAFAFLLSLV